MDSDTTVLRKVFDTFIEKLGAENVSPAVIARLKDLLKERQFKVESIKKALFSEENFS